MLRALVLLSICLGAIGCAHGQDHFYVMQPGDTAYSASRHLRVPVDQLMAVNGIDDPTNIAVGTRLRSGSEGGLRPLAPVTAVSRSPVISIAATPPPAVATFLPGAYTMVRGDTLYSIAARFDLDVGDLLRVNDIDDPRDVAAGTVLTLKGAHPRITGSGGPRLWPTDGELQPLTGKLDGIAIRGDLGQPVRSVSSGTVTWSGPRRGYGHVILVRKDRYVYGYLNNEQVLVAVGDQVQVGSQIAQLGINPHDNTAQLYFVVLKDGRFIDPGSAPRA